MLFWGFYSVFFYVAFFSLFLCLWSSKKIGKMNEYNMISNKILFFQFFCRLDCTNFYCECFIGLNVCLKDSGVVVVTFYYIFGKYLTYTQTKFKLKRFQNFIDIQIKISWKTPLVRSYFHENSNKTQKSHCILSIYCPAEHKKPVQYT